MFTFEATRINTPYSAFSGSFKGLAALITLGAVYVTVRMTRTTGASEAPGQIWLWGAVLILAYTAWAIWTSKVSFSETALRQTWIWDKEVLFRDLAYAKVIRVRGLEWLIAPRIFVRTVFGRSHVLYAADPELLDELERLARALHSANAAA